jgi:hypothetical protein
MLTYTVYATDNGADTRAAAAAINRRLGDAGDTSTFREVEREIVECSECIRDDLTIETRTIWIAWIDGAEDDAVPFAIADGEDVIEAAASVLGGASRDVINVRKA